MADKAGICLMGGCTNRPRPEWNALCDPEAARIVFGTGVPITMVGLDVTEQCQMSLDQVRAIGAVDRPVNRLCFELIQLWSRGDPERRPLLHDPLAVAWCSTPPSARRSPCGSRWRRGPSTSTGRRFRPGRGCRAQRRRVRGRGCAALPRPFRRDADLVSRSLAPAAAWGGRIGGELAGGGWGGSQERNPEAVDRDSAAAPGAQRATEST